MRIDVTLKNCTLSPADHRVLERRARKLEKRLGHIDPDLVHLQVAIEKQPRRIEFHSNIRLVVMNRVIPAGRNSAPTLRALITGALDDLERAVNAFNASIRRDAQKGRKGRKRGLRAPRRMAEGQRALTEARARMASSLAPGPPDFDKLAETQLLGVRRVIFDELARQGRTPHNAELDEALSHAMSVAARDLDRKPSRWTLHGWLAWVARREIRRAARV